MVPPCNFIEFQRSHDMPCLLHFLCIFMYFHWISFNFHRFSLISTIVPPLQFHWISAKPPHCMFVAFSLYFHWFSLNFHIFSLISIRVPPCNFIEFQRSRNIAFSLHLLYVVIYFHWMSLIFYIFLQWFLQGYPLAISLNFGEAATLILLLHFICIFV